MADFNPEDIKKTIEHTLEFDLHIIKYTLSTSTVHLDSKKVNGVLDKIEVDLKSEPQAEGILLAYEKVKQFLLDIQLCYGNEDKDNTKIRINQIISLLDKEYKKRNDKLRKEKHRKTLERLARRAELIQRTFGSFLEIVLHDLGDYPDKTDTLAYIYGSVTGRKKGDTMTNIGLEMVDKFDESKVSYKSEWEEKDLKSTSILLNDEDGYLYGVLCFNLDLNMLIQEEARVLSELKKTESDAGKKIGRKNEDLVDEVLARAANPEQIKNKGQKFIHDLVQHNKRLFSPPYLDYMIRRLSEVMHLEYEDLMLIIDRNYLSRHGLEQRAVHRDEKSDSLLQSPNIAGLASGSRSPKSWWERMLGK